MSGFYFFVQIDLYLKLLYISDMKLKVYATIFPKVCGYFVHLVNYAGEPFDILLEKCKCNFYKFIIHFYYASCHLFIRNFFFTICFSERQGGLLKKKNHHHSFLDCLSKHA